MSKIVNSSLGLLIMMLLWATCVYGVGTYHQVTIPPSEQPGELQIGVTHQLWVPAGVKTVRAIIVHQHGCGVGACKGGATAANDLHWQALARKWDCALLGPSYQQAEDQNCRLWCDPRNGSSEKFVESLAALAEKSGHAEIADVPWCLWGHSGGGFWASLLQMQYPERIIAIWFQSGTAHGYWVSGEVEAPPIPPAAMKIPMMANPGLKERDHERFRKAWFGSLGMFQDYRSRGAPIAFAPDPLSGHETRDSRYLAIPFFDACLGQRLPEQNGAVGPLRDMDASTAWLAPVPTDPTQPQPAPVEASEYKGDPLEAVWLPNQRVAQAWSEFVRTGAVSDDTPPPSPTEVELKELTRGVELSWKANADLESGISAFEVTRDGAPIGRIPEIPSSRFGRPLFQRMSYHDTPEPPLPELRFVDESGSATHVYAVRTINSVDLASPPSKVRVYRDLVFAEVGGQPLKLDLCLPDSAPMLPLVVWIHGGGWRAGSKDYSPLRGLVEHGYALASISYRFTDKAIFPAQIHDCKAAIRWLRGNAERLGYQAESIAVAGGSAGGHLALLLGVSGGVGELEGDVGGSRQQSSRVQAVIDYYGPSDFVLRGQTQPDRAYTEKSGSFALLGGRTTGKLTREVEAFASPATYVTADDPPLLVFHGDADEIVLLDQSQRIVDLYRARDLEAQLIVLEKAGHGGKQFFEGEQLIQVLQFLKKIRMPESN